MKRRSNKPLEAQIIDLYRGDLADFTPTRNALARRLHEAGDVEAAAALKRLPKPNLSAWVVNRLYARSRKTFDRLLAAGADLRRIQRTHSGSPEELRAVMERRRSLLEQLSARAAAVLEEAGQAVTRGVLRRVETNLDRLATCGTDTSGALLGRLAGDLEAPGFDAFLVQPRAKSSSKPTRSPRAFSARDAAAARARVQRLKRAREVLNKAEHEQERRRFSTEAATAAHKQARQSLKQLETREDELKLRLRQAHKATRRAETQLERAHRELDRARRAQAQAAKRVSAARRKLETLRNDGK